MESIPVRQSYDGLGRTFETRSYETGSTYIKQTQTFDALGRVKRSYNPHRTTSDSTYGWADSTYDALGRVTNVTTSDNAIVTSAYSGNAVTVTDQASKVRRSITDAAGRLKRVDEPDANGNLGAVNNAVQWTGYTYDVLDNLTAVQQGVQTRSLAYDGLSRLMSSANPESGTVYYGYDYNGNLTSKTDARSITTTIAYDALNRPVSKTYNDSPQTAGIYYHYDSQTLPSGAPSFSRGYSAGRLVAVTYGASSSNGTYRAYDALGRVSQQFQQTDGTNYQVDAGYNLASSMTSQTYPGTGGNRRAVSYSFDTAGRISSLTSNATSYSAAASVSSISYSAHGALSSQTLGNGLLHQIGYNQRLQPTSITLGSHLSLSYSYGSTTNNGNIASTDYYGGGIYYSQSFTYDSLNRLSTAQENSGTNWTQTNGYDRYGNRTVTAGFGQSLSFYSNNRVVGLTYDAAGNVTNDNVHSYAFDAENKIIKLDNVAAYVYDGEGKRVRKLVGENTRFIYGITGELLAEYNGSNNSIKKEYVYGASGLTATIEPTTGTQYATTDHLGSPRVITTSSGTVAARRDFMPFGEEIASNIGGRSGGQGWGASNLLRQQFTSYERDNETGLDFAKARYYSSQHGRFTGADPIQSSNMRMQNPQIWNAYSYAANNPMLFIDSEGKEPTKKQAAIVNVFIKVMSESPSKIGQTTKQEAEKALIRLQETETNLLKGKLQEPKTTPYFNLKEGRYIYTEKGGWIDMVHFLFYAGRAYKYKQENRENPIGDAVQDGYLQEKLDDTHSSYSYEDLPSDKFGADFAVNFFDPNSNLNLQTQIKNYLNDKLGATDPEKAPNYNTLPEDDDGKSAPSRINKTTKPVYVRGNP